MWHLSQTSCSPERTISLSQITYWAQNANYNRRGQLTLTVSSSTASLLPTLIPQSYRAHLTAANLLSISLNKDSYPIFSIITNISRRCYPEHIVLYSCLAHKTIIYLGKYLTFFHIWAFNQFQVLEFKFGFSVLSRSALQFFATWSLLIFLVCCIKWRELQFTTISKWKLKTRLYFFR